MCTCRSKAPRTSRLAHGVGVRLDSMPGGPGGPGLLPAVISHPQLQVATISTTILATILCGLIFTCSSHGAGNHAVHRAGRAGEGKPVKRTRMAVVAATALAALSAGLLPAVTAGAQAGDQGHNRARARAGYEPVLDPADFVPVVTNPYFPLPRGRTWVYRGMKDGVTQVDRVHVTGRTRVIEGITATAVSDVSTHRGRVLERTTDWYAQDRRGNVWYLG